MEVYLFKERINIMSELWDLFLTFCRIGGLTFGGGYAMLPMIQEEVVKKRKWATEAEVLDYYAVGQCTPGVIAVNTATFIGYKNKGIPGAIAATIGVVFPSLIIIMIIAAFIKNFASLEVVQNAFSGIRVAVAVLIVKAIINLWQTGIKDIWGVVIFIIALSASLLLDFSPIYIVIGAVIAGIILNSFRKEPQ